MVLTKYKWKKKGEIPARRKEVRSRLVSANLSSSFFSPLSLPSPTDR